MVLGYCLQILLLVIVVKNCNFTGYIRLVQCDGHFFETRGAHAASLQYIRDTVSQIENINNNKL